MVDDKKGVYLIHYYCCAWDRFSCPPATRSISQVTLFYLVSSCSLQHLENGTVTVRFSSHCFQSAREKLWLLELSEMFCAETTAVRNQISDAIIGWGRCSPSFAVWKSVLSLRPFCFSWSNCRKRMVRSLRTFCFHFTVTKSHGMKLYYWSCLIFLCWDLDITQLCFWCDDWLPWTKAEMFVSAPPRNFLPNTPFYLVPLCFLLQSVTFLFFQLSVTKPTDKTFSLGAIWLRLYAILYDDCLHEPL